MANKKTKLTDDFQELIELSKVERESHTYETIDGKEYIVAIDKAFSVAKIKDVLDSYFKIMGYLTKQGTDDIPSQNLLFAIIVSEFTDKNFTTLCKDELEKYNVYTRVATILDRIELKNGLTLFQQIIEDMGEENLNKILEKTEFMKDIIEEKIKELKEADKDGEQEI